MERSHFLSGLPPAARKRLLARGRRAVFTDGTVIFHQDDPGDSMLVIETGRVEISSIGSNGRRILLGHLGSGDLVGELSLFGEATRSGDVTAAGPVTGMVLTFSDVKATLTEHPEAMFSVLLDLSRKLRSANALAENRALDDGAARLARCLLELTKRWGRVQNGGVELSEKFPQATLGQMASLSRENVNRRLRAWQREGWIQNNGGKLFLCNTQILEQIAECGD
ncbi:MAG: Crp/Fnr family transcriptional regulator [Pseudomonadota bacterium]